MSHHGQGVEHGVQGDEDGTFAPILWANVDQKGRPLPTFQNARKALQASGAVFYHNLFLGLMFIAGDVLGDSDRVLSDGALLRLRTWMVEKLRFDPGKDHLFEAVQSLCIEVPVDPIRSALDACKWDGQFRLDTWLSDYAGADDTPLNRAIGVLLPVAMVRRIRQPGCKYDTMVVLEGKQGCGKSTLLQLLAGGATYFTDVPILTRDPRAVAETLKGKWVVEIPELAGLRKAEVEDVKALLSRQDDSARPAYGRFVESQPRRCVIVGTTNASEYLLDETGNRRFAPVKVGQIDLAALKRDRAQLLAEAAVRENAYGSLTIPLHLRHFAAKITANKRVIDPWSDTISAALAVFTIGVSGAPWETLTSGKRFITTAALQRMLNLSDRECTPATSKRIAAVMSELGWEADRRRVKSGPKLRGFVET